MLDTLNRIIGPFPMQNRIKYIVNITLRVILGSHMNIEKRKTTLKSAVRDC